MSCRNTLLKHNLLLRNYYRRFTKTVSPLNIVASLSLLRKWFLYIVCHVQVFFLIIESKVKTNSSTVNVRFVVRESADICFGIIKKVH